MRNKTKRSFIGKLAVFGLAFAIAGSPTRDAQAQGKLEAAVEGGKLALEYGEKLAKTLTGLDRGGTIVITNHTDRTFSELRVEPDSGKVIDFDRNTSIPAGGVGGVAVEKADSALTGAVGVITYKIARSKSILQVMYSIPYNQSGLHKDAKNWFAVAIAETEASPSLFDAMYEVYATEAGRGVEQWEYKDIDSPAYQTAFTKFQVNRLINPALKDQAQRELDQLPTKWVIKGTMTDAGVSRINIDVYEIK